MNTKERQLLTIVMTPDIEDTIVDWLLEQPDIEAVNSYSIKSYNKDHSKYTPLEKVTGWKRKTTLRIILPSEVIVEVTALMKVKFANSGIYYRIASFLDEGIL
ncbi:MAG: DUF3240 family protein [Sulfurimonas sp.]|jgi:hypothetical protein